jgi:hypothetical protein
MRTQLVLFAMGAVTLVVLDAIGEADVKDGCDMEIDDRDGAAVMRGDCGMGVIGGDGGMGVIGG